MNAIWKLSMFLAYIRKEMSYISLNNEWERIVLLKVSCSPYRPTGICNYIGNATQARLTFFFEAV